MELFLTSRKRNDFPFNLSLTPTDMPIQYAIKAFDLASENRQFPLLLNGNEPALYPDLDEIFKIAAKRQVAVTMESSCLMPSATLDLIIKNRPTVLIRLYRPLFYTEQDLQEVKDTIKKLLENKINLQYVIMIDSVEADYAFIESWFEETQIGAAKFRADCTVPPDKSVKCLEQIGNIAANLAACGGTATFDCGFQPCTFSNELYGRLAKCSTKYSACAPHLEVMPDGRMAHCRQMTILPGPDVLSFKSFDDLITFYYDVFRNMQITVDPESNCAKCVSRNSSLCTGPTMAAKATENLNLREKLKQILEQPKEADNPNHLENVWKLAVACIKLALHDDAIECLEEMRRINPENPDFHYWLACEYWDVGRRGDAEDEFHKCSRLSPNPVPSLVDLHRRLVRNGNAIRARMLLEEIKRLAAQQQTKQNEQQPKQDL